MESTEVRLCYYPKPPQTPAGSQFCGDVQTETCTDSDGGTGSVGHINHVAHQICIKKEEPEEEGYVCEAASGSVELITPVDHHIHVKKEEPEDENFLCGEASSPVENIDQQNRGFEMKYLKEEVSEDEDYLCTTTVCGVSVLFSKLEMCLMEQCVQLTCDLINE
ncbi:uncharacterized protein LOC128601488 isoform X2 [Ictalurus furcatus]|uniref:uncharacterized protein LOC128601488 isoform X2 n=1 Tax=Ictalurus furcatus TaxID=66913 RepID=UPI00234FFD33|nr:uncharacterized protein LOC128601488 isoform X2 [Ictalurus furcatus]